MFTTIAQRRYQRRNGHEHIWSAGDDAGLSYSFAGAVLGSEIVRIRAIRGALQDGDKPRYQLADGGAGTLPYHSWIVAKGDENWPDVMEEAEARSTLEPYLQGFAFSSSAIRLTRPLASQERIYGLGERTGDMNKRGQAFPVWNADPPKGHNAETVTMYTSIPFYLGLHVENGRAYGVLIDHTGLVEMDMGKSNAAEASITVQGDSLIVYFFVGPTPSDVLRQYTELTGRMPLPPYWALGYHQSRWSYASEQQVRQLAIRLRERAHPCDAIWLDIDYMNDLRNFTWNPETFSAPKPMIDDLHAQGFQLVTIIDPGTKTDEHYFVYQQGMERDYFCRLQDGTLFQGEVWPGACVFPDFSRSEVRTWWGNLYKDMLDQGVDGIWNDMNEPSMKPILPQPQDESPLYRATMSNDVLHLAGGDQPTGPGGPPVLHKFYHNAYGMEMARATYEALLSLRPSTRPFVLTRAGTAGLQRYAAVWTGDNTSWWEHLLMAIPMCLNISMSGVPFVGVDIGGFWNASNGELLARFTQLSALLPLCRNHNATGNPDQEPWAFGEPYESIGRKAIELRYRLMPYLYTLFYEAATTGAPIIRPLYYHYPQDERACDTQSEFLLGDALLSAPIYEQGATSRSVYLPEGNWFDYWDDNEYPGMGWSDIAAPLERWPLFVRGNSILPSGPLMQYTRQHSTDPLTFTCYMAEDGLAHYTLYEDDGSTLAYRNGTFAQTSIACRVGRDLIEVEIEELYTDYRPQREWYEVVVHVGGQVLQQRVKAGRGKIVFRL
ncbi:MAG TPA: TIM-barrel domain-containing protein [Ktedonobacteraceae bacterium]|nr:TIM-barrel domain-containing protein [Ktedonobacteraceae bacterium]